MKFKLMTYHCLKNHPNLYNQYFSIRKKVFIDQKKWPLKAQDGLERDQYDNATTWYVLGLSEDLETVYSSIRLFPTRGSYLTLDVFASLIADKSKIPDSASLFETTRLFNEYGDWSDRIGHSRRSTVELFASTIKACRVLGMKKVITVTDTYVESCYVAARWLFTRLGEPQVCDGVDIVCGLQETNMDSYNGIVTLLGYEPTLYLN